MQFLAATIISLASLVAAVDMTSYVAGEGVEPAFAPFLKEYYRIQEDKLANATFIDLWTPTDAVMILQGTEFDGAATMLAVRNKLLPATGTPSKNWWHVMEGAVVLGQDTGSKTYMATFIVQTTYVPGNCSQAQWVLSSLSYRGFSGCVEVRLADVSPLFHSAKAAFTVLKDDAGQPRLTPHTQNLRVYNLTMNTVLTPTAEPCTGV